MQLKHAKTVPPELFERITDILAEMVLEDIRQYPQRPVPLVDTLKGIQSTLTHG